MADDVVDYSGTIESDSESDKVPRASTGRLPAPARACILRRALASFTGNVWHADLECGCAPSPEKYSIAVCGAIPSDPSTCQWRQLRLKQ
jgi:hypothetical protein